MGTLMMVLDPLLHKRSSNAFGHLSLLALAAALGASVYAYTIGGPAFRYIFGRSESLCGMLGCASFTAFLYRRSPAISWAGVFPVLLLFGAAVLTKEQAVAVIRQRKIT